MGTQAGKVLVFNILGILVLEIVLKVPVTSVQWAGDMSQPSILPVPNNPLSPKLGPVIESLMMEAGEIEGEHLKQSVEQKKPSGQQENLHSQILIERPTVSFSDNTKERTSNRLAGPSHVHETKQWHRTNISARPRIETTPRPILLSAQPPINKDAVMGPGKNNVSVQDVCSWPDIEKPPVVAPHRERRVRASKTSSQSLRKSGSSEQDFFTPPSTRHLSTREDKGKGKAVESMHMPEPSLANTKRDKPLRSSKGESSESSEYDLSNDGNRQVARATGRLNSAGAEKPQPAAGAISHPARLLPVIKMKSLTSWDVLPIVHTEPASDIARSQLEINSDVVGDFRSGSKKRKLLNISLMPAVEASSSNDFSSSLYSRPKSRMFRGHSKAFDGGTDAATPLPQSPICVPRQSFSFDNGLHDVQALAEQRYIALKRSVIWTGGKREEISRLRDDNTALKRQIADLRDEFRMLKDVLLQAESRRLWRECAS